MSRSYDSLKISFVSAQTFGLAWSQFLMVQDDTPESEPCRINLHPFSPLACGKWYTLMIYPFCFRGHGGRVVALLPPTSEAGDRSPYGLKWESWYLLAVGRQFTVHNPSKLYVLVSSALPTTRRDMTCTVLKATLNPK